MSSLHGVAVAAIQVASDPQAGGSRGSSCADGCSGGEDDGLGARRWRERNHCEPPEMSMISVGADLAFLITGGGGGGGPPERVTVGNQISRGEISSLALPGGSCATGWRWWRMLDRDLSAWLEPAPLELAALR
ncbi:hypothetical protein T492DRAFT_849799 [Pavlovales sp. CCMP2436]|nr:hypothetical protein T492DRAFT_849799 [Pavlovales sp. CCMP2436]